MFCRMLFLQSQVSLQAHVATCHTNLLWDQAELSLQLLRNYTDLIIFGIVKQCDLQLGCTTTCCMQQPPIGLLKKKAKLSQRSLLWHKNLPWWFRCQFVRRWIQSESKGTPILCLPATTWLSLLYRYLSICGRPPSTSHNVIIPRLAVALVLPWSCRKGEIEQAEWWDADERLLKPVNSFCMLSLCRCQKLVHGDSMHM